MSSRLLQVVDVHSHIYLPRYVSVLRSRASVPRIISRSIPGGGIEETLHILPDEPSGGRPIGSHVSEPISLLLTRSSSNDYPKFWDRDEKLRFMDKYGIDVSIVRFVLITNPSYDAVMNEIS
jgi:aminocarboxymuconate-semialdehyde decarboxylase